MLRKLAPVVLCLALAACGKESGGGSPSGGAGGGGSSSGIQNGGATPEETFKILNETAKASNWKGMLAVIHPDDHDYMLFGLMFGATFAGMGDENQKAVEEQAKAILAKHKVPEKKEGDAPLPMDDKEKLRAALKDFFKDVPDKAALCGDLIEFLKKHAKKGNDFSDFSGVLKDVKIEGDSATATIERAGGKTSKGAFAKKDGRWYMKLEN